MAENGGGGGRDDLIPWQLAGEERVHPSRAKPGRSALAPPQAHPPFFRRVHLILAPFKENLRGTWVSRAGVWCRRVFQAYWWVGLQSPAAGTALLAAALGAGTRDVAAALARAPGCDLANENGRLAFSGMLCAQKSGGGGGGAGPWWKRAPPRG